MLDALQRPLESLRVSVTDRCNLRCAYCMPEEEYRWLPRTDLLSYEEIARLAAAFREVGVRRLRLTGGEPLLRRNLAGLIGLLDFEDLALTTNGILLAAQARELREAGLHRVTVSLDTLRPERFRELARRDSLEQVLEGIASARREFGGLKLDTVVMRGVNEDELAELLAFARSMDAELRFIEYMDVGGATRWSPDKVVSRAEILERVGPAEPLPGRGSAPAERFALADGQVFGIVASTTAPFCSDCDRARLTADGRLFTCLYATRGTDLREPLRAGESDQELVERVRAVWRVRSDRGAEERAALRRRGSFVSLEELRQDPHLEMHTRGG